MAAPLRLPARAVRVTGRVAAPPQPRGREAAGRRETAEDRRRLPGDGTARPVDGARPGRLGDGWGGPDGPDGSGGPGGPGDWSGGEGREGLPIPTAQLGLTFFLASATLLFASLVSAYLVRMDLPDWVSLPVPGMAWVSTGLLVAASLALHRAARAERAGDAATLGRVLPGAALLGLLFVGSQLAAWWQLRQAGHGVASDPASSFFYLMTALHGLHVLGGLVALGLAMARARRVRVAPGTVGVAAARLGPVPGRLGVALCATYWHFLLAVWVVLLGLMLIT